MFALFTIIFLVPNHPRTSQVALASMGARYPQGKRADSNSCETKFETKHLKLFETVCPTRACQEMSPLTL